MRASSKSNLSPERVQAFEERVSREALAPSTGKQAQAPALHARLQDAGLRNGDQSLALAGVVDYFLSMRIRTVLSLLQTSFVLSCGGADESPDGSQVDASVVQLDASPPNDATAPADDAKLVGMRDAGGDAGSEWGTIVVTDQTGLATEVSLDLVTVDSLQPGALDLNAGTTDFQTQIMVNCVGTARSPGTYLTEDPYSHLPDHCSVDAVWRKGSYSSFGQGSIVHRLVDNIHEFSFEEVVVHGVRGQIEGVSIILSGTFQYSDVLTP